MWVGKQTRERTRGSEREKVVESDIEVLIARMNKDARLERDERNDERDGKMNKDVEVEASTVDRRKWMTKNERKRRQQRRHGGPLTSSTRESES